MDDQEPEVMRAAEALRWAKRVAVLTGAGISAESGVPTFRASDGLWEGHRIQDVATPRGFSRNPGLVWSFYNARRANVGTVQPNPGHLVLVELERRFGDQFALITQNVDGLHRRAGSRNVLEVHGSLHRTRCTKCAEIRDRGLEPLGELPECPTCGGLLRPDIVWFEEPLPEETWMKALVAAQECDLLLVVGTSAVVYPAASLIPIAKQAKSPGATVIEFNLDRTAASDQADIGLYGPSGELLPRVLTRLNAMAE
jgi:NAD-dependent deacetylase